MARRRKQQPILPMLMRAFAHHEWTYTALGEELGMTHASASRKLRGKQAITIDELEALAPLLGLEIIVRPL